MDCENSDVTRLELMGGVRGETAQNDVILKAKL